MGEGGGLLSISSVLKFHASTDKPSNKYRLLFRKLVVPQLVFQTFIFNHLAFSRFCLHAAVQQFDLPGEEPKLSQGIPELLSSLQTNEVYFLV